MAEERNHATVRDYLLALRRRRFAILGVVVVAAVVAGVFSLSQAKQYTARAQLQALDLSQSAGFAGLQQAQQNLPATTSAQLAQMATRTDVLRTVKARLKLRDTIDQIQSRLAISEDQQSNFVVLSATASTPSGAARLANALARAVAHISNRAQKVYYANIARKDRDGAEGLMLQYGGKTRSQLSPNQAAKYQADYQQASQLAQLAARMQAFSNVVTVAQVVSLASVPTSPSAPHPISTIILGAVVGLLLGLLLARFLESLDRRLRRPDETEDVFGLPVAGALPKGALGATPVGEGSVGLAAFRIIRTNLRFLSSDDGAAPRSILVTSSGSEEGKTTVALGLALSSAASGFNTLLIEADTYRPVHAQRLGLQKGPGLADYLKRGLSPSDILQTYTFVDPTIKRSLKGKEPNGHTSTLVCITAGDVTSFASSDLESDRFAEMISVVSKVYDLVVIDTGPLLAVPETMEMATLVDALLFCVRMGHTTLEQARAARAALSRLPERPTGMVLTQVTPDGGAYYGYTYSEEGPAEPSTTEPAESGKREGPWWKEHPDVESKARPS